MTSGGRLEFGIGLGSTDVDYTHYGIPRVESRARFEEAAEIVVGAWTTERFSHRGRYWQVEDVVLYPKPVQRPHPPIWVAGTSTDSLGWAGRHGYSVMSVAHVGPPELVRPGATASVLAADRSPPPSAAALRTDCPLRCRPQSSPSATAPLGAATVPPHCWSAPRPPRGQRSTAPSTASRGSGQPRHAAVVPRPGRLGKLPAVPWGR